MRCMVFMVLAIFYLGCKPSIYLQRSSVKLSKPNVSVDKIFFEDMTNVVIGTTAENANILYSDSNNEWQKYISPLVLDQSSKINIKAQGGGFISSDTVCIEVLKMPKNEIISILSERPLDEKYGKGGLDILINRKKGGLDFNLDWLGYLGDTISFDLNFDVIEVDHLIVSTLRNQGAWIFSPFRINVYNEEKIVGSTVLDDALIETENANLFTRIGVSNLESKALTVEIIAPEYIPEWHPGSGNQPWIFIDEILVY